MKNIKNIIDNFQINPVYFYISLILIYALSLGVQEIISLRWGGIVAASCRWDCFWYQDIARNGYSSIPRLYDDFRPAQANWAFFPLYPLLTYLMTKYFDISIGLSGFLINIILWPAIVVLCWIDLKIREIKVSKFIFYLFFIVYPFNIWYYAQYSEAVYGFLLMGAIVALRKNKTNFSTFLCFLLAMSRPTGFLMGGALAIWWLLRKDGEHNSFSIVRIQRKRITDSLLLLAGSGAGLSVYVVYLFHVMGDGFAFKHVEIAWGKDFHFFLYNIVKSAFDGNFISLFYCVTVLVTVWGMCVLRWGVNAFLMAITAVLSISTGVISVERYFFGNPLVIQFLAYLVISRSGFFLAYIFAILFLLRIFVSFSWYGGSVWLI